MGKSKHAYETNLAAEFYVMAALYRRGADASLSLGNKKAVDITVIRQPGDAVTIDVKGVAGKWDWPADNIAVNADPRHFLILLSFEGRFREPRAVPSAWIVPHKDINRFFAQYQGRRNIS
jgi:hypothetical protein